jgi:hypothetical protein
MSQKVNWDILSLLRKIGPSIIPVTEAAADKPFNFFSVEPPLSADFFAGDIPPLGQSVDRSDVNPEIIGNLLYRKHLTVHSNPPKKIDHKFRSNPFMDDKSNICTTKSRNERARGFYFALNPL